MTTPTLRTRRIAGPDRLVSFTTSDESPASRVEPVALELAKKHLRVTSSSHDDLIGLYLAAARAAFEGYTERQTVDAIYEYPIDGVPLETRFELPRPPLVRVESIVYDDADGNEQTFSSDSYRVIPSAVLEGSPATGVFDPYCACGSIELVSGVSWPTTSGLAGSLRIRRTCGYGASAGDVPGVIQAAVLFLLGHFYRNRSEVTAENLTQLPMGADLLMKEFKYRALHTVDPTAYVTD